jgi:hypothetical protein
MKTIATLLILLISTLPLYSQIIEDEAFDLCPDPTDDWNEDVIEAVVDITIDYTVEEVVKRSIPIQILAKIVEIPLAYGTQIVVKKLVLQCEHCKDFFCKTDAKVGDPITCGDYHCTSDGVMYTIQSINNVRRTNGKVRVTIYGITVPSDTDILTAPDPYVEVWEDNHFKGSSKVREGGATGIRDYFTIDFAKYKRLKFVIKERDFGEDETLCGVAFSQSLPIKRNIHLKLPRCGAVLVIGTELL